MVEPRRIAAIACLAAGLALSGCRTLPSMPTPFGPKKACGLFDRHEVPKTARDAERIGRRIVGDLMGQPTVLRQEPFRAGLADDRWIIRSTPWAGDPTSSFLIVLDAKSGCPLYVGPDI